MGKDAALTVLVMGVPNVGKSSLLRALSSGKPEVQNYAFTTRGLVVGHMLLPEWPQPGEDDGEHMVEERYAELAEHPTADVADRGEQSHGARRRGFARLTGNDDARAVRLHSRREAARAQAEAEQQKERVRSSVLSSLSSHSASLPVQLIDTPGLLFRPDAHRKPIELLTLTSLHHLPLQLVLFVVDESGACGWDVDEQESVRREVRTRYASRLSSGRVAWIDVRSKSDVTDSFHTEKRRPRGGEEEEGAWGEEERALRTRAMEEHRRLYAVRPGEGSLTEGTAVVRVSIHQPRSIARLQSAMTAALRSQLSQMRAERGERFESIEDEFKRTFGEHAQQPQQQPGTDVRMHEGA